MSDAKGKPHKEILKADKYDLFVLHPHNRMVKDGLVRKKMKVLDQYGWCPGAPMVCAKILGGKFEIRDGQHRFEAAKRLGIAVWYVVLPESECPTPEQLNAGNGGAKTWGLSDYVDSYSAIGNEQYVELRDFAAEYRIPLSHAAALLFGLCGHSHGVIERLKMGEFVVKDRKWADKVGLLAREIGEVLPQMRTNNAIGAISRMALVKEFDGTQMIEQCQRYANMLRPCGTMDQYSQMFEEVYNFQRKVSRLPLKFLADAEARKRNVCPPQEESKRHLAQATT